MEAGEPGQRVSIRQVAEAAGVSMSTVSNVLNNPHRVAAGTRQRVGTAMERVGYVRNGAARQLRGAPSSVVGCVVLDTANAYYSEVARGVEDRLVEAGCMLVQCSSDARATRESRFLRLLEEQGVRGVLVSPAGPQLDPYVRLSRRGTPVVLLDHPRDGADLCAVTVDNIAGGELAAGHLIGLGHRRIAFLRAALPSRSISDRTAGIYRAVRAAGLTPAETVTEIPADPPSAAGSMRTAVARLLSLPRRPTAVMCFNDAAALGAIRELRRSGVAVPGEMSVTGYDDVEFAAELSPGLTTVRQPKYDAGHAAAELLLAEGEPDHRHRERLFRPELVRRGSTGPPSR